MSESETITIPKRALEEIRDSLQRILEILKGV